MSASGRDEEYQNGLGACGDCRFWRRNQDRFGVCRVDPPRPFPSWNPTNDDAPQRWHTAQPPMRAEDSCGRFEPLTGETLAELLARFGVDRWMLPGGEVANPDGTFNAASSLFAALAKWGKRNNRG